MGASNPAFINTIISFLNQALGWLVALAIPATALVAGYHALARASAEDEMVAAQHSRALKNSIIYGVVTILAGSIVTAILSAF